MLLMLQFWKMFLGGLHILFIPFLDQMTPTEFSVILFFLILFVVVLIYCCVINALQLRDLKHQ